MSSPRITTTRPIFVPIIPKSPRGNTNLANSISSISSSSFSNLSFSTNSSSFSNRSFSEIEMVAVRDRTYSKQTEKELEKKLELLLEKAEEEMKAPQISAFREDLFQLTKEISSYYPDLKLKAIYKLIRVIEAGHANSHSSNELYRFLFNLINNLDTSIDLTPQLRLAYARACLATMELIIEFRDRKLIDSIPDDKKKELVGICDNFKTFACDCDNGYSESLLIASCCLESAKIIDTFKSTKEEVVEYAKLLGTALKSAYDKDVNECCGALAKIYENIKNKTKANWHDPVLTLNIFMKNKWSKLKTPEQLNFLETVQKILMGSFGNKESWKLTTSCLQILQKIALNSAEQSIVLQAINGKEGKGERLMGLMDFCSIQENEKDKKYTKKYNKKIFPFALRMLAPLAFFSLDKIPEKVLSDIRQKLSSVRSIDIRTGDITGDRILYRKEAEKKIEKEKGKTISLSNLCRGTYEYIESLFAGHQKLREWFACKENYIPEALSHLDIYPKESNQSNPPEVSLGSMVGNVKSLAKLYEERCGQSGDLLKAKKEFEIEIKKIDATINNLNQDKAKLQKALNEKQDSLNRAMVSAGEQISSLMQQIKELKEKSTDDLGQQLEKDNPQVGLLEEQLQKLKEEKEITQKNITDIQQQLDDARVKYEKDLKKLKDSKSEIEKNLNEIQGRRLEENESQRKQVECLEIQLKSCHELEAQENLKMRKLCVEVLEKEKNMALLLKKQHTKRNKLLDEVIKKAEALKNTTPVISEIEEIISMINNQIEKEGKYVVAQKPLSNEGRVRSALNDLENRRAK